jgi:ligand-binding SRPBCC domain-containing protein
MLACARPPGGAPPAMTKAHELTFTSRLRASPAEVWAAISTMEGVNDELFPLARMTHPPDLPALDPANVPIGRRAFRSWVLLFGLLPIDYDDITLAELDPGRGFVETSTMLSQRAWRHERRLEATPDGFCALTDRLAFSPRVPALAPAYAAMFRLTFLNRHRRLRRKFGAAD